MTFPSTFGSFWFWRLVAELAVAAVAGAGCAYALTAASIRLALRYEIVARPNERTSHEGSVPRIGGIGIAVSFLLAIVAVGLWWWITGSRSGGEAGNTTVPRLDPTFFWSVVVGGIGAFALGLWDDVRSMRAEAKLVFQILVALVPPLLGLRLSKVGIPGAPGWPLPPALGGVAAFVWILFWMNAYNFMDGINGIAGRFGEIVFLGLLLMVVRVLTLETYLLAFLAGACFGFLRWNFPVARTFLGDCGSYFLGFMVAVWSLHLTAKFNVGGNRVPAAFLAMVILTLPYSWDVVYTLIRRGSRGENLLQAHRSHLYQRLMATGLDHVGTLVVCEWTFYVCGLAAVVLVRLASLSLEWGSIGVSIIAMIWFTAYVVSRKKEGRTRGGSPDSMAASGQDSSK